MDFTIHIPFFNDYITLENSSPLSKNCHIGFYGLIILISFLCYSNTFSVPWILDDPPNIVDNPPVHIDNLLPETLVHTFFAKPFAEGKLYRPVPMLSFALNWYFSQDNTFGYHLVNLIIHLIAAIVLFKTILLLFSTRRLDTYTRDGALFISLLATILWAIHPIQTQAVTYIVQRMASMAGMFFITATYCFICARLSATPGEARKNFLLCLLFFILALLCKENSITLIPALLIIELIFFQPFSASNKIFKLLCFVNIILVVVGIYYFFSHNYLNHLFTPIGSRPFSVLERIYTQWPVLLFYLSLIIYPLPARFSIDHTISLSTSLVSPWYTLPALFTIIALLVFGILYRKRYPLLSLAILFFFVTHSIEASFIPLELVFEHRNYIPTFFIFPPIAAGIWLLLNHYYNANRLMYVLIAATVTVLVTAVAIGTYSRNEVWKTEESLWTDALSKAPNNARPYAKLGKIYGWEKPQTPQNMQTAIALLEKSTTLQSPRRSFVPAMYGNVGKVYLRYHLYEQAEEQFNKSLDLNPGFVTSRIDLARTLALSGKFEQTIQQVDILLEDKQYQTRIFNLRTLALLWLNRPEEALKSNYFAMRHTTKKASNFYISGVVMGRAGYTDQGKWFLGMALKNNPGDMRLLMSLIENRILANDKPSARRFASRLINIHSIASLVKTMEDLNTDYSSVPVNVDMVKPFVMNIVQQNTCTPETAKEL